MKSYRLFYTFIFVIIIFTSCHRQVAQQSSDPINREYTDVRGNIHLLGQSTGERLAQPPFNRWFDSIYAAYPIDTLTVSQLKPALSNKHFLIFMGTWCGDSRREVPRLYKVLRQSGVPSSQISLINVHNADSLYKQSPTHEERGRNIFRVPTILVLEGNKEKGRIVESPVTSLEKDLLAIATGAAYEPKYRGAAALIRKFAASAPAALEKDLPALAEQLKPLVISAVELNSLGYVLMGAQEMDRALVAFKVNALLYPATPNVYDSLGDAYLRRGDRAAAREQFRKVLTLEPANKRTQQKLEKLGE